MDRGCRSCLRVPRCEEFLSITGKIWLPIGGQEPVRLLTREGMFSLFVGTSPEDLGRCALPSTHLQPTHLLRLQHRNGTRKIRHFCPQHAPSVSSARGADAGTLLQPANEPSSDGWRNLARGIERCGYREWMTARNIERTQGSLSYVEYNRNWAFANPS